MSSQIHVSCQQIEAKYDAVNPQTIKILAEDFICITLEISYVIAG